VHLHLTKNVLGAQKAGTTSTAMYLFRQADVCGPTARPGLAYTHKEAHFFDQSNKLEKGLSHYPSLFEKCTESKIIIDATPNYISYPERVRKIYEEHGTADTVKVLMILREPVSREISWYNHLLRENLKTKTPEWAKILVKKDGTLKTFAEHANRTIESIKNPNGKNFGLYSRWLLRWFRSGSLIASKYWSRPMTISKQIKQIS
jgi:hypothetical protein